jgi:hypothetical protein
MKIRHEFSRLFSSKELDTSISCMSPEAKQKLIEAGVPPLIRRSSKPPTHQPYVGPQTVPPRPVIHVDDEFIETQIKKVLSRLPIGKDAYTFPEIAKALGKSENWVRIRFKEHPHLRNTGNGSKKYFEVPCELLIAEVRKMYTSR